MYFVCYKIWLPICSLISQLSRHGKKDTACRRNCAAIILINLRKSKSLGTFWIVRPWTERPDIRGWTKGSGSRMYQNMKLHLSDLWKHPSCWPLSIVLLTRLSPSKNALFIYSLFVLRFYGPVNPMGSCQARSVYLTTCLLGRLSPLSG